MRAAKGDRLVVHSRTVGGKVREGEVLEVRGPDGSPPYVVRWEDTGQEAFVYPGSDTTVRRADEAAGAMSSAGTAG